MTDEDDGYKFIWMGWCNEGTHDKVWGYIKLSNGSYYNFWGARGKSLRFKRHTGSFELYDLTHTKRTRNKERYTELYINSVDKVWPGFRDEFEKQFVMAKFSGKILTDDLSQSFI